MLAEHTGTSVYVGDDPTMRDLLLEYEELTAWQEQQRAEANTVLMPEDEDDDFTSPDVAPMDYDTAFVTGDPMVNFWEQQLAAGEIPDLDM